MLLILRRLNCTPQETRLYLGRTLPSYEMSCGIYVFIHGNMCCVPTLHFSTNQIHLLQPYSSIPIMGGATNVYHRWEGWERDVRGQSNVMAEILWVLVQAGPRAVKTTYLWFFDYCYQNHPRCRSGSKCAWRVHRLRKGGLLIGVSLEWYLKFSFEECVCILVSKIKVFFRTVFTHTLSLSLVQHVLHETPSPSDWRISHGWSISPLSFLLIYGRIQEMWWGSDQGWVYLHRSRSIWRWGGWKEVKKSW